MANSAQTQNQNWTPTQAYVLAVICLVVGIALGYFIKGSASPAQPATATTAAAGAQNSPMGPGQLQAIPQQQSADVVAETAKPLLDALKSNPDDWEKLVKLGDIYYDASVYPEAISYYTKAVKIRPDPNVLTDLGTAYFYTGDSSTALKMFDQALKQDPKLANALFNTGIVKWQGLKDPKGAIAVWEKLLKDNPNYPARDKVQELIERAKAHGSMS